ncbi:MAG: PorT family protein [Cyclobacteriaceae bacterium]|nr:PorT family protein [Cyclobacteriaceae bacterium]
MKLVKVLPILVFMMLCELTHAQHSKGKGLPDSLRRPRLIETVEFFAGPSLVSVRGNELYDKHGATKIGWTAGVAVSKKFLRNLELSARFQWEQNGYLLRDEAEYDAPDGTQVLGKITNDIIRNYLTIGLVPRFVFGRNFKFYLGAGGYVSFLQNASTINKYYYPGIINRVESTGYYFSHDAGLSVQLGGSYPVSNKLRLTLQVMGNDGLMQLVTLANTNPSLWRPEWNRSVMFLLGVSF